MRQLVLDNSRLDVDRLALASRVQVLRSTCATPPSNPTTTACGSGRSALASRDVLVDRLRSLAINPADRLLLLDLRRTVVFDSAASSAVGYRLALDKTRTVDREPVLEGDFELAGASFIGGAVNAAVPQLGARLLVVARSLNSVTALAASTLVPRLLLAAAIALLVAVVVALLLSRAFARPLTELAAAAEDIAAGSYQRRVRHAGRDEVGIVAASFNRMAEAVERSRSLQRDFLANVSHELKTPLTSLIGFSQALKDGTLLGDEEKARAAHIIHEESERLLRLSQELLDLARVETGQMAIHASAVDLRAMLEQELELLRPRAQQRGLALELKTPPDLPPVSADPERLHQVMDNLLDNAVKYAAPGAPVSISASNGDGHVHLAVGNPVGDHRPDPERMFERFYRADPSRSAAGGVGLGLAISRELVAAMGGRLWADLSGDRLTMRLTLPAGTRG